MIRLAAPRPEAPSLPPQPAAGAEPLGDHLIALPGGAWALWRCALLRGAGFPASDVLCLSSPGCAAAVDRVLALEAEAEAARAASLRAVHAALDELRHAGGWEDRERRRPLMKAMQAVGAGRLPRDVEEASCAAAFAAWRAAREGLAVERARLNLVFADEVARASAEIARVAAGERFREAVIWQNRHACATALGELARGAAARTSQRRQHEELVAGYLQRYCVKNDTIGFFGPVGFAELSGEGPPVSVRQGSRFLAHREVYFEAWCIEALATTLASEPACRPWLVPRLKSSFHLEGDVLHRPFGEPLHLSGREARLLARCRTGRNATSLARDLLAEPETLFASEDEVFELLERLCRARLVTWRLDVPLHLHPDRRLAECLEQIGDGALRTAALSRLEELRRARAAVALAAGDARALDSAMRELESTFTRLTGTPARHLEGQMYAGRGLVYEDCRRDAEVRFGGELLARMGPPLNLFLDAARWVAGELARAVEGILFPLYAELAMQSGSGAVHSHALFAQGMSILYRQEKDARVVAVEREYQNRWAQAIGPIPQGVRDLRLTVAEVAQRLSSFDDPAPAFTLARYFSPDVMIAARSLEALERGDFELVLGEVHAGNTLLWSCFLSQHPQPEQIAAALEADAAGETVVLPHLHDHSPVLRLNQGVDLPWIYHLELADAAPSATGAQALPAGEVVVESTPEGLEARTRDGRVRFPAIDFFTSYLIHECSSILGTVLPPDRHTPRITIGHLVVSRERWRFAAGEIGFAAIHDPRERFLAFRRWARDLGLPRFCFYKLTTERKPCYLDAESPIYADIFARLLRAARTAGPEAATVSLTEMLPRIDQTWLSDAAGNLYTSELRIAALERGRR